MADANDQTRSESTDQLIALHTALIDSRNGYQEALEDAEGKGLTPLFRDMIALRDRHTSETAGLLRSAGATPNNEGSFMSTVHKTVISIRSMLTGLDESILPQLISGEERIVESYDTALEELGSGSPAYSVIAAQRETLLSKISAMRAQNEAAA